ncbi:MAG: group II intron reverse transcriptase/maturase [Firmicutes bacterium]|nr:group II intron reverse transcriptase/maturase [Bacillota bacterium]
MKTKLRRISELSKENPNMVFTSLGHLIDEDMLRVCHRHMDGKKAVGIDGMTKEMYEENLEENLRDLADRLRRKAYRPKPARRVEIPKDNGKMRPLSIYCYEDKLVQEALRQILVAVFEPHFYDEMEGFRPNRGCHDALKRLAYTLQRKPTSWVLDADIKGFFDHLDHEWIVKFVESRIKDPNITRLIRRMLKAGIMKDYQFEPTEEGSGQGSVCSPILSCIYMHYVLVWWFKERVQPQLRGYGGIVVYADDFVATFQYRSDAERFYEALKRRMAYFGLEVEENKTRLIEFGRFAEETRRKRGMGKPETFDFLGFTHYCSKGEAGWFRVKRKTSKKKFAKSCRSFNRKIRDMRTNKLGVIFAKVNQMLVGYYNYYGITDNYTSLIYFLHKVDRMLFFWLNRRSNKKSYTWEQYNRMREYFTLATPKIWVNMYQGWVPVH